MARIRPKQKVIIYRHGISPKNTHIKYMREYNGKIREEKGYEECPRCKTRYKNPENAHYADFKNKIRCMPKGY